MESVQTNKVTVLPGSSDASHSDEETEGRRQLRFFSMFSGIGGFELGIQNAVTFRAKDAGDAHTKGYQPDDPDELPQAGRLSAVCVGYSEINQPAIKTYKEHFDHDNYGDATTIDASGLPDIDLIVGGFPCQAFSVAGRRRGFDEARGTLFFDIARLAKAKRPRHLVLENVKGLLNHDGGKTFQVILGVLAELGYRVEWCLLNSADFGVPQNRERVYIIGHLRDECGGQVFPITAENPQVADHAGGHEVAIPVLTPDRVEKRQNGRRFKQDGDPSFTVNTVDRHGVMLGSVNRGSFRESGEVANTITASYHKGHDNHGQRPMVKVGILRTHNDGKGFREMRSGLVPTIAARARNDGSGQPIMLEGTTIRRLTPTECERLQGFPDNWTIGSDTQRYMQCGNAVTVNVVEAVIGALLKECDVC